MIRAYRDLPLAQDATNRFLPWTIGLMVFVATLALAATMVLAGAGGKWRSGLAGSLTVQVLPLAGAEDGSDLDARTDKALKLLRRTPGIEAAEALDQARIASLLEPWLGPRAASADLPLPRLIDVRLAATPRVDISILKNRLAQEIPGATLDDHGVWLERLIAFARGLEAVAIVVMILIGVASIATVVFTTRTGLSVHRELIELLHLIGARDEYIAAEFQGQALRLALRGALAGFALAVLMLIGIGRLSEDMDKSLLPDLTLSAAQWLALLCLPLIAVLIGTVTARVTVLRSIGRRL